MNIFEIYLKKIKDLIIILNKEGLIEIPKDLNSINVDIPPEQFDSDISTNVAMVLSKINKTNPLELAKKIESTLKKNDTNIDKVEIVKPGFINIKFKSVFCNDFLKEIINNNKKFGINANEVKKNFGELFFSTIENLSLNEWSGPHESVFGQHIILLKEIKTGFSPPLEKVLLKVQQDYLSQAQDQAIDEYINEIRSQYRVIINPDYKF